MSIYNIGTDIEEIDRFVRMLAFRPHILKKIFKEEEWNYAFSKPRSAKSLAGIWCAKEAVAKAFTPLVAIKIQDITIVHASLGYPKVNFTHPELQNEEVNVSVSISHSVKYATASAIVSYRNI